MQKKFITDSTAVSCGQIAPYTKLTHTGRKINFFLYFKFCNIMFETLLSPTWLAWLTWSVVKTTFLFIYLLTISFFKNSTLSEECVYCGLESVEQARTASLHSGFVNLCSHIVCLSCKSRACTQCIMELHLFLSRASSVKSSSPRPGFSFLDRPQICCWVGSSICQAVSVMFVQGHDLHKNQFKFQNGKYLSWKKYTYGQSCRHEEKISNGFSKGYEEAVAFIYVHGYFELVLLRQLLFSICSRHALPYFAFQD